MSTTDTTAAPAAKAEEDPKKVGQWLDPFPIDNVAVHASLLPTGKILCWGRRSNPMSVVPGTMDEQTTVPFLLDPADESCVYTKKRPTQPDSTGKEVQVNLFCSGHCFLPNGNLFVIGGHIKDGDGARQACIYDPFNDEWKAKALPNAKRWYPSAMSLPDGRVLTISGCHDSYVVSNEPQIWQDEQTSPKEGWIPVSSPPDVSALYPRLHLTPDGKVFVAGPQAKSQCLDLDASSASAPTNSAPANNAPANSALATSAPSANATPTNSPPANTNTTNASAVKAVQTDTPKIVGTWNAEGPLKGLARNAGERQYGSSAMYDSGKIIWTGGGNAVLRDEKGNILTQADPTQFTGPPTNQTEIIDLNDDKNPQWKQGQNMLYPRRQHNATTLPDGTVLVTGGTQGGGFNNLDPGMPVHAAELWNPVDRTWTEMAKESSDRCYHGNALLLPSGEVLSAGSGEGGGPATPNPNKYNLTNAQLFRPPYLFKGKQPTIQGVPRDWTLKYGEAFSITIEPGESIARVSWIRLGSVTHGMNMNQAVWFQQFESPRSGNFDAQAPSNRYIAPPGHYMVFFVNTLGVPSVAPIAKILPDTTDKETTPKKRASSTAADAPKIAISHPERNKQIIAKQNKPAVVVGLIPACPYGLGPCWGGAHEGLNAINDIDIVRPVPDQANSVAFVYLKQDEVLPDIDVWRHEFAKSANGSYGMRGIEMTLSGVVTRKRVGSDEVLTMAGTPTRPELTLAPYKFSSKLGWDMNAQAPHPVTTEEARAYASLSSAVADEPATVQVIGRLHKHDAGVFSLDVRGFQVMDSTPS